MLQPIFKDGKLVYNKPTLPEIMDYANKEMETLWPEYTRLVNPEVMWVQRSKQLSALRNKILQQESQQFYK